MGEERTSKRQQQAAATQEQLLAAARDVFDERGYQGATVGAITARASTAHGTFYLYFRNKQHAFEAVLTSVTDELYRQAESVAPGDDPRARLEAGIRTFLEAFVRHRGLWRSVLEASLTSPELERAWLSLRSRFVDRIADDLQPLVDSGAVRDMDVPVVANALGGMVEWAATTQYVLGTCPLDRSVEETAAVLADLWVAAVFAPAPATT